MLIYYAGKYAGKDIEETTANIEIARKESIILINQGFIVLCPQLNTANFHIEGKDADFWYEYTLNLLDAFPAIALGPNWLDSQGARNECRFAYKRSKKIYVKIDGKYERLSDLAYYRIFDEIGCEYEGNYEEFVRRVRCDAY